MADDTMNKEELVLWRNRFVKGAFFITFANILFFIFSHFFGFLDPSETYAMNRLLLIAAMLIGFVSACVGMIVRRDVQGALEGLAVGCGGGVVAGWEALICHLLLADSILGAFGLGLILPFIVFVCTSFVGLYLFHALSYELLKIEGVKEA